MLGLVLLASTSRVVLHEPLDVIRTSLQDNYRLFVGTKPLAKIGSSTKDKESSVLVQIEGQIEHSTIVFINSFNVCYVLC